MKILNKPYQRMPIKMYCNGVITRLDVIGWTAAKSSLRALTWVCSVRTVCCRDATWAFQSFQLREGALGVGKSTRACRSSMIGRGTQGEGFAGISSGIGEPIVLVAACFSRVNMSLSVESTRVESLLKIL